jgi:hypothetical protein
MSRTTHEVRAGIARQAFETLGRSPSQSVVLQLRCDSAHHVAAIYRTEAGLIYHSVLQSTAHGRRDRVDEGHNGTKRGKDWFDLLVPTDDPVLTDELPAACECGPYTLSREELVRQVGKGVKRLQVT